MSEGSRLEVEGLRDADRSPHGQLGQDGAAHFVDLALDTALQHLHQILDRQILAGQSDGIDVQRDPTMLHVP